MTGAKQKAFVSELLKNMEHELHERIDKGQTLESWDGIELRWLIADLATRNTLSTPPRSRRKRDYNNHVRVHYII